MKTNECSNATHQRIPHMSHLKLRILCLDDGPFGDVKYSLTSPAQVGGSELKVEQIGLVVLPRLATGALKPLDMGLSGELDSTGQAAGFGGVLYSTGFLARKVILALA